MNRVPVAVITSRLAQHFIVTFNNGFSHHVILGETIWPSLLVESWILHPQTTFNAMNFMLFFLKGKSLGQPGGLLRIIWMWTLTLNRCRRTTSSGIVNFHSYETICFSGSLQILLRQPFQFLKTGVKFSSNGHSLEQKKNLTKFQLRYFLISQTLDSMIISVL
jgi:hypothetical protein